MITFAIMEITTDRCGTVFLLMSLLLLLLLMMMVLVAFVAWLTIAVNISIAFVVFFLFFAHLRIDLFFWNSRGFFGLWSWSWWSIGWCG